MEIFESWWKLVHAVEKSDEAERLEISAEILKTAFSSSWLQINRTRREYQLAYTDPSYFAYMQLN
jgi:hypothetical protein